MLLRNDFKNLYNEIEKMTKRDEHHIVDQARFLKLKNEILNMIKLLFSETSREYKVVKLTNSPATVFKVMKHIDAKRSEALTIFHSAVNM